MFKMPNNTIYGHQTQYIHNNNRMSQSEQSSSEHSTGSKDKKPKKRVMPMMDPAHKVKLKTKQIVINLSMTHYDVITDVAEDLEWRIQYSSKKGDWDVLWVDHMIEPDTLIKMHFFQKISHFPGIYVLARKNLLGMSFCQMAKRFPDDYQFFPKTWLLPAQFPELRQEIEKGEQNNQTKCFIVKPEADCQGRGIFLTFKTDDVENGKHYVVQQYLQNPFLVEGLKFDFRVYVLLCGTNPMRLYVYQQGLARFATEKYQQPNKSNIKKMCMHLTNYAINKKNPKYIFNTSVQNMHTGHKRTLTSVFKNMQKRGFNVQAMKKKIDDVLVKTIIMGQPLVSHQYKFAQPDDQYRNMCFHILGVDVMIDELLDPYVLEVNHTPSFATDTPLDYFIKFNLIKDTLVLMNIREETKKILVKKTNNYQRERVTNAKRLIENEEQRQRIKQAQFQRDQYENAHLGRYRKVYPVDDEAQMEKYSEFMKCSEKIYFSQNNVFRTQIQMEKEKNEKSEKEREKLQRMRQKFDNERQKMPSFPTATTHSTSKKTMQKKISYQQTNSYSLAKNHHQIKCRSQSQRIMQQETAKNSSLEFFNKDARQIRISSLLGTPMSSMGSNLSNRISGVPSLNKITKSSNQIEDELMPYHHRHNLVKNLPKIQQIGSPLKKSSTIESQKNKYISLRRKKIPEVKEQKIRQEMIRGEVGAFLTPKMIKFDEELLISSERGQKTYCMGLSTGNLPGL